MENNLVLVLILVFGIYSYSKNDNVLINLTFGGQLIALSLRFFNQPLLMQISLYLIFVAALLMIMYSILNKQYPKQKRLLLLCILLPFVIQKIFAFQHYPHQSIAMGLLVVPLISWIYITDAKKSDFQVELPILHIFVGISVFQMVSFYF